MKEILLYSGPNECLDIINKNLGVYFDIILSEPENEKLYRVFESCTVFLDASMKVPITANVIQQAKKLKLVVTATTGANHIDSSALQNKNIPLLTLKGQKEILNELTPAAELSWLLLMACSRKLRSAIKHVENSNWERTEFPGVMLKDKTIGIIGYGRIGSWIGRYAQAFGMKIFAYDPNINDYPDYVIRVNDIEELVSNSDFISLHVNLVNDNIGFINKDIINKFKKGSIFINTSRGELVDEEALVNALENKLISAVGIDTLQNEPHVNNNVLWRYSLKNPNVIITPHIGGFSPEAVIKVVDYSCKRIIQHLGLKNE